MLSLQYKQKNTYQSHYVTESSITERNRIFAQMMSNLLRFYFFGLAVGLFRFSSFAFVCLHRSLSYCLFSFYAFVAASSLMMACYAFYYNLFLLFVTPRCRHDAFYCSFLISLWYVQYDKRKCIFFGWMIKKILVDNVFAFAMLIFHERRCQKYSVRVF